MHIKLSRSVRKGKLSTANKAGLTIALVAGCVATWSSPRVQAAPAVAPATAGWTGTVTLHYRSDESSDEFNYTHTDTTETFVFDGQLVANSPITTDGLTYLDTYQQYASVSGSSSMSTGLGAANFYIQTVTSGQYQAARRPTGPTFRFRVESTESTQGFRLDMTSAGDQPDAIPISTTETVCDVAASPNCSGRRYESSIGWYWDTPISSLADPLHTWSVDGSRVQDLSSGNHIEVNVLTWHLTRLPDQDVDGVPDVDDDCPGTFDPEQLCQQTDTDGDGIHDAHDNCPTVANPLQVNHDNDVAGDACDDDDDNDLLSDAREAELGTDPFDPDSDGDSVLDGTDQCQGTLPGVRVDPVGCASKRKALFVLASGYGGINSGGLVLVGGDLAHVVGEANLVAQVGSVCLLDTWTVSIKLSAPTSIPLLWNGAPAIGLDLGLQNLTLVNVIKPKPNKGSYFSGIYTESVVLQRCVAGPSAQIILPLEVSGPGVITGVTHQVEATAYSISGALLSSLKDKDSAKPPQSRLNFAKDKAIRIP